VAYAIAEQLMAVGETVSFIGLIDVTLPSPDPVASLTAKLWLLEFMKARLRTDAAACERVEKLAGDMSLLELVEEGLRLGVLANITDAQGWAHIWERVRSFNRAASFYQPPSLPLAVHLFQATQGNHEGARAEETDPRLGRQRALQVSSPRLVPVPGNHMTIMSDPAHRRTLAGLMSDALRTASAFR
jgi:thioesterase domain-containing protein